MQTHGALFSIPMVGGKVSILYSANGGMSGGDRFFAFDTLFSYNEAQCADFLSKNARRPEDMQAAGQGREPQGIGFVIGLESTYTD